MNCKKCGDKIVPGSKKCNFCGTDVTKTEENEDLNLNNIEVQNKKSVKNSVMKSVMSFGIFIVITTVIYLLQNGSISKGGFKFTSVDFDKLNGYKLTDSGYAVYKDTCLIEVFTIKAEKSLESIQEYFNTYYDYENNKDEVLITKETIKDGSFIKYTLDDGKETTWVYASYTKNESFAVFLSAYDSMEFSKCEKDFVKIKNSFTIKD